jgi:uncharacterized membrane protein
MTSVIVLIVLAGIVSIGYILLYKYIENRDTIYITLLKYDDKNNTTFTKETIAYRDHENNFVVHLDPEFSRYVCCLSVNGNRITIETKNSNTPKRINYIVTGLGLIKIYED